ncbi:MAG: sigma-70 family RNA polymerase sigma factor [Planctomycetes bacterium]|nr:sigma-70 family RNA polymerase sigma factor [Planctomycetota bacterium]
MTPSDADDRNAGDVTRLLRAAEAGLEGSQDALLAAVYGELQAIARAAVRGERGGATLQATALVHDAWLRLQRSAPSFADRRHYFRAASRVMRQLLVERHRRRHRLKRGGDAQRSDVLDELEIEAPAELASVDLLALDEALTALEARDPRMAQIVQLRFFAGLSVEESAAALEVSERTVKREWAVARAWLFRQMG